MCNIIDVHFCFSYVVVGVLMVCVRVCAHSHQCCSVSVAAGAVMRIMVGLDARFRVGHRHLHSSGCDKKCLNGTSAEAQSGADLEQNPGCAVSGSLYFCIYISMVFDRNVV